MKLYNFPSSPLHDGTRLHLFPSRRIKNNVCVAVNTHSFAPSWAWDEFVTLRLLPWIREFIHILHRNTFCRAWYCDAACGYVPVSASAKRGNLEAILCHHCWSIFFSQCLDSLRIGNRSFKVWQYDMIYVYIYIYHIFYFGAGSNSTPTRIPIPCE